MPDKIENEQDSIESLFELASTQYQSTKKNCEDKVVLWRWASDEMYSHIPLNFELNGHKPGRYLKSTPKNQHEKYEYGFDVDGEIVIERRHIRFDGYPECLGYYETFFIRSHGLIDAIHYDHSIPKKELIFFHRGIIRDGRLEMMEDRATHGKGWHKYLWQNGRIVRIDNEHIPLTKLSNKQSTYSEEIRYDQNGKLHEILMRVQGRSGQEVIYNRSWLEAPLQQLVKDARSALIARIIELISELKLSDPVFALAISWGDDCLSITYPFIGICTVNQRDLWIQEYGNDVGQILWNTPDYPIQLAINSDAITAACAPLQGRCELNYSDRPIMRMLSEIAKELGEKDWTGLLNTSSDFVCFAISYTDMGKLKKKLKFSAGDVRVHEFTKNGWMKGWRL